MNKHRQITGLLCTVCRCSSSLGLLTPCVPAEVMVCIKPQSPLLLLDMCTRCVYTFASITDDGSLESTVMCLLPADRTMT